MRYLMARKWLAGNATFFLGGILVEAAGTEARLENRVNEAWNCIFAGSLRHCIDRRSIRQYARHLRRAALH